MNAKTPPAAERMGFHFYFNSAVLFFSCCSNTVKTFESEKVFA